MNRLKYAFIAAALIASTALTSMAQMTPPRASPHDASYTRVGGKLVAVYFGRPYTKNRKIWGGLVPWDKAWRLGADEATTLITQSAIVMGGTPVPAGAYTLYMIPSETGVSKLAISKTVGEWGEPGDEKNDLARVDLKKEELETPVEQLTITLGPGAAGGAILKIAWDKASYSVDLGLVAAK